jgi:hypothetical protein
MTAPAQEGDFAAIASIYRHRHPNDSGSLTCGLRTELETFVTRDEGGSLTGFAMVMLLDSGVQPYGVIHQCEISPTSAGNDLPDIRHALVEACVNWLAERGARTVYARTLDKGTHIVAMMRYAESEAGWGYDCGLVRLPPTIWT